VVTPTVDQGHEVPVHGEVNMISGGFSGEDAPPPGKRTILEK